MYWNAIPPSTAEKECDVNIMCELKEYFTQATIPAAKVSSTRLTRKIYNIKVIQIPDDGGDRYVPQAPGPYFRPHAPVQLEDDGNVIP